MNRLTSQPTTNELVAMKSAAVISEHHGMPLLAGLIDMATDKMEEFGIKSRFWRMSLPLGITISVHY